MINHAFIHILSAQETSVEFMKINTKMVVIFTLFVLLCFTACNADTPNGYDNLQQYDNKETQPAVDVYIPKNTEQPTAPPTDADAGFLYAELFAPIINAYAKLEQSGYIITDEELANDSLAEIQLNWGEQVSESLLNNRHWIPYKYGWDNLPVLMYSLHSMSGFHLDHLELLIGVESNGVIEIISIYVIELFDLRTDDEPDNYGSGVRNVFSAANRNIVSTTLTMSTDGYSVITTTWRGNAEETYEYFQVVGPGIGVGSLDMIKTVNSNQRYSVCYIGPCDFCDDGLIKITEMKYIELINKYGTAGYNASENIKARYIHLEWNFIHGN